MVSGPSGSFVLELPMGNLFSYLPTETVWEQKDPPQAKALYPELDHGLEAWCKEKRQNLLLITQLEFMNHNVCIGNRT